MNRVIVAICILVLCGTFIGVHTYQIFKLNEDTTVLCDLTEQEFYRRDWDGVEKSLQNIQKRWNKSRFWACLTIDTKEIEEIEISLKQSMKYAKEEEIPDFIGEFTMFRMRLSHLPHQEGFSIEELL